jgi:hypothetical protein
MTISAYLAGLLDLRGGLKASDAEYGYLFGRDSLRTAKALASNHPNAALEILAVLAGFMGVKTDPATGEFPNAIPHQVYRQVENGLFVPDELGTLIEKWPAGWGIPIETNQHFGRHFVTYNASDVQPLFVIVLARLHRLHPRQQILTRRFTHWATGEPRTLGEAAERVLGHIARMIGISDLELYEVPSTNPRQTSPSGVLFDAFDAYMHPTPQGPKPINWTRVAYVHNQSLAYEALLCGHDLGLRPDGPSWTDLARSLRRHAISRFELDDGSNVLPPAAIDRTPQGQPRPVRLQSLAVLELLAGRFLRDLPFAPDLVCQLIKWLYNPEVLTPVGGRCQPLVYAWSEGGYAPYQGTASVWAIMQWIVAEGLLDWELYPLFHDLAIHRMAAGLDRSGSGLEFWPVHRETGLVCYHPDQTNRHRHGLEMAFAELPQARQSWSLASGYAALGRLAEGYPNLQRGSWQRRLVREALAVAKSIPPAATMRPEVPIYINTTLGRRLQTERIRSLGLPA